MSARTERLCAQLGLDALSPTVRACRECGCTDDDACVLVIAGRAKAACMWIEYDLCSACTPKARERDDGVWVHPADQPSVRIFDRSRA